VVEEVPLPPAAPRPSDTLIGASAWRTSFTPPKESSQAFPRLVVKTLVWIVGQKIAIDIELWMLGVDTFCVGEDEKRGKERWKPTRLDQRGVQLRYAAHSESDDGTRG
jgi:hypothetical protein